MNHPTWYCKIHGILIYWRASRPSGLLPMKVDNNYVCRACNGQPYPQAHNWKQRMKR